MRTIEARVNGESCVGYLPESREDIDIFEEWVAQHGSVPVAVDSETTGLDPYAADFRVRLVQFGTDREGWLIPVEWGDLYAAAVRRALQQLERICIHNMAFDVLAFDVTGLATLEELVGRVQDTRILAHLHDSRPPAEGGTGTGLKALAVRDVDPEADDGQRALNKVFRSLGHTTDTGWAHIDLLHPEYLRYALLDVLLLSRLRPRLWERLAEVRASRALVEFEHHQARIGMQVRRTGMPVDTRYTTRLRDELTEEAQHYAEVARRYGVSSVHAPAQVAAALLGMGEELTERTERGAYSVGKEVLLPLADLDRNWARIGAREPNPLADAVLRSKRASKWAASYAAAMLAAQDAVGRIHPVISTMGARTARWSVSSPPLQQLPSSDWRIRRCIAAEPGHVIVAADFAQVELRVLAALAGAARVVERINRGEDLHSLVTRLVYPELAHLSDEEMSGRRERKVTKTISLGKAYAGGMRTLARQTGLPLHQVKIALRKYDRALPEFRRWQRALTDAAQRDGYRVRTPSGRVLRLNRDRAYTAIAYMCQSSARDILGEALLEIDRRGLLPYVIGVVHDEVVAQVPEESAGEIARELGEAMTMRFHGVDITSDPDIYGPTWGHGYAKRGSAAQAIAATMEEAA